MAGWVKLHRSIKDNPLWNAEPFSKAQFWMHLLLSANYEDGGYYKNGQWIEVKRGQIGESILTYTRITRWSKNKVVRFLKQLEKQRMIELETNHLTSIVTICNYEEFQGNRSTLEPPNETTNEPSSETPSETPLGSSGETHTRSKEVKEVEEVKNNGPTKRPVRKRFVKPEHDEVLNYFIDRDVEPMLARQKTEEFFAYYDSVDWHVGRNKMKDWKGAVRTWVAKLNGNKAPAKRPGETLQQFKTRTEQLKAGGRQYLSDD